jgi:hypothetical protein
MAHLAAVNVEVLNIMNSDFAWKKVDDVIQSAMHYGTPNLKCVVCKLIKQIPSNAVYIINGFSVCDNTACILDVMPEDTKRKYDLQ